MIQPTNVSAQPDARGGALALSWINPNLPSFQGTQVLRGEHEFPPVPADVRNSEHVVFNDTATPAGGRGQFLDTKLRGEATYYYAIVAYDSTFRPFPAFVSAMTTSPYQTAAHLYASIPGVYRAYDTAAPPPSPAVDPADGGKGQLQRLAEMFGAQFDLVRSYGRGMQSFFDATQIDGKLLPLLAQWIGWPTNYAARVAVQRNEVSFAPRYYATIGVAANLRATINRLVPWDARIKEFVHNIFCSNRPGELSIHEQRRLNGQWQPATSVSFDVAYEGKPSALLASDGRPWVVYHARQSGPGRTADRWHLWYKIGDRDDWLPARRLTQDAAVNRCPAAIQRASGSIWVFWSSADPGAAPRPISRIRLQQLAAGRPALNARAQTTNGGPFAFADGDTFSITIGTLQRTIVLRTERFADIAHATAGETAAVLDQELPGVDVTATADGKILFASQISGVSSQLAFPNSTAGSKLGLPPPAAGADALSAQITASRAEPFAPADGDMLVITVDGDIPRTITFTAAQSTADQIAAAINQVLPGVASSAAGKIRLTSPTTGAASLISVNVALSTAAPKLGFGASLPATPATLDDTEPSGFEDAAGDMWLFWSSLRSGQWNIWLSRFDGTNWGAPKALTAQLQPDREPFAIFDPASGGRIWVFWSRKKVNGLWNVFFRTTAKLDFNTLADADWTEFELTPVPANYDNREAAATLSGPASIDLYVASNRVDGWNIWNRPITLTTQGPDAQVTSGQFTHRAPVPLNIGGGGLRLFFRGNDSLTYTSAVYPASATVDARYVGSTTVDTRNTTGISLHGSFDDIGHYTYDTPKATAAQESGRRYSRDSVGVFLVPDTSDQQTISRESELIAASLARSLPIQVRAVLLIGEAYREFVYSYDQRDAPSPQLIAERMTDTMT